MKSMLRRCSSAIAIIAASLVLFTATIAVAFDKPPPPLDKNQLMVANYTVCVPARHQAIDELKASVSFRPTLNAATINDMITGQVPEVTARSAPQKAVAPTLDVDNQLARKVAEATPGYITWIPVPAKEPLEVARSGSQIC